MSIPEPIAFDESPMHHFKESEMHHRVTTGEPCECQIARAVATCWSAGWAPFPDWSHTTFEYTTDDGAGACNRAIVSHFLNTDGNMAWEANWLYTDIFGNSTAGDGREDDRYSRFEYSRSGTQVTTGGDASVTTNTLDAGEIRELDTNTAQEIYYSKWFSDSGDGGGGWASDYEEHRTLDTSTGASTSGTSGFSYGAAVTHLLAVAQYNTDIANGIYTGTAKAVVHIEETLITVNVLVDVTYTDGVSGSYSEDTTYRFELKGSVSQLTAARATAIGWLDANLVDLSRVPKKTYSFNHGLDAGTTDVLAWGEQIEIGWVDASTSPEVGKYFGYSRDNYSTHDARPILHPEYDPPREDAPMYWRRIAAWTADGYRGQSVYAECSALAACPSKSGDPVGWACEISKPFSSPQPDTSRSCSGGSETFSGGVSYGALTGTISCNPDPFPTHNKRVLGLGTLPGSYGWADVWIYWACNHPNKSDLSAPYSTCCAD